LAGGNTGQQRAGSFEPGAVFARQRHHWYLILE
jgi:hypothetical protein